MEKVILFNVSCKEQIKNLLVPMHIQIIEANNTQYNDTLKNIADGKTDIIKSNPFTGKVPDESIILFVVCPIKNLIKYFLNCVIVKISMLLIKQSLPLLIQNGQFCIYSLNSLKNKQHIISLKNNKGQRNLHIHVLLTMHPLTENWEWGAKTKKVYELDENGKRVPLIDKKTGQKKVDKQNRQQSKTKRREEKI